MAFRVLTYNTLNGGTGREDLLFETIQANRPDLIILQEVDHLALLQDFASRLGMDSFYARARLQILKSGSGLKFGRRSIGLLSRFPIVAQSNHHPFPVWRTLLEATIEYAPDQRLTIWGVHLKADLSLPSELWRLWEISTILKRIALKQSEKYLMAGDFNTLSQFDRAAIERFPPRLKLKVALQFGKIYRLAIPKVLAAGFVDCYRALHPAEDGFTLPPPHPNTRLDYIFASPALASSLRRCEVVTVPPAVEKASDHYPLIAQFEL